jgi:Rod binding domain-containing protein
MEPGTSAIPHRAFTGIGAGPHSSAAVEPNGLVERQQSFQAALGRAKTGERPIEPEQSARDAAEQLITQSLILPLLKQLRSTNQSAPPFAPSAGERQFGALGDAQLAQRITRASHFPLVDRLAQDLLKRAGVDVSGRNAARETVPQAPVPGDADRTARLGSMMWRD